MSGAPSVWINVASGYFMLSGALVLLGTVFAPLLFSAAREGQTNAQLAVGAALGVAWAAAMFWTSDMLDRRLRRGAYVALIFTILSVLGSPTGTSLLFFLLSLIILASIWRDLK